jgi:outer membrane receptor protein involved in Fe transport
MRNLFLLLTSMLTVLLASAQAQPATKITGIVQDSLIQKPLSNATISLLQLSKTVATTTTNESGAFTFQQLAYGTYNLTLTSVGYGSHSRSITLSAEKPVQDLGILTLTTEGQQLGNVTVTAQKALIEDKGDRLIYNAEKDISNAGGTAADVLRKVPNLTVDLNGNVQMRGNSNIKVLVNGKPSAMMARNLADALRQMPASVIKSVEVITSPGAKYDAEGAAGVINIITKKGLQGFNGSVNATAGNMNRGLGTSLNYRKKKLGFTLSANGYQYRNINDQYSLRTTLVNGQPANILERRSSADNTGTGGYGEMSLDYDPDSTSHINFSANVWGGNYPSNNTMFHRLTDPAGVEIQSFRNESLFRNPYGNGQLDLGYTKTFRKPEQEFSLLGQFSRMPDNYFYNTDRYDDDVLIYRDESTNYSRNKEYTIQTDYTYPFTFNGRKDTSTLKLELGGKTIIRDIGSEYRVEVSPNGQEPLELDPSQTNDFDYTQRVYSGYTSLRFSNKRKWSINAGARLEHTDIDGNFKTTGTEINSQYSNLIPSITVSKGIKSHTVKISYTQRITRPLIWYLNPWINQSDPKNIYTGNPDLEPELNHATELGFSTRTTKGLNINTAFYWRLTDNAIEYLSRVDPSGVSTSRPENIAERSAYGFNANLSAQPNKDWNLSGGGDVRFIDMYSQGLQQQADGWVWNTNINTTYKLPKEITLQANGGVGSGWISLQRTTTSKWYWYGLSAKHQFLDKKATLTLAMNNPFTKDMIQKSVEASTTFRSQSEFAFVNRSVRLTFEWRFGQMSTEGGKQGKKIKNDDSGR